MNSAEKNALPGFQKTQYDFAAHIRNPSDNPPPEQIEDRRMHIYRELFFNNIEGFLSNNFPVIRSIMDDKHWHRMARDFFAEHHCKTPVFSEIAGEFFEWLVNERQTHENDPAFLLELAHYEWMELVVDISDADTDFDPGNPNGDLLREHPVLSPLVLNLSYRFPVHQISPDFQPTEPGDTPTHLVIYRDRQDEVHFLEINAITQQLIEMLKQNPQFTGLEILTRLAESMQHPQPESIVDAGKTLLYDLRHRDIIRGTRQTDKQHD